MTVRGIADHDSQAVSQDNESTLQREPSETVSGDREAGGTELRNDECNLSDIVKIFGLSPPTISHHLKELSNADLIETEKRGKYLVARINKETLGEVKQILAEIEGE